MDVALLAVLRDGLLRRSEAAELRWADVEFQKGGAALLQVRRSKTDPEGEGAVLYIGQAAAAALQAIRPEVTALDPEVRVFRPVGQPDRPESEGRHRGRGPGRGLHRSLGKSGHGPGPGRLRRGTAGIDDGWPVEELLHASPLHRPTSVNRRGH